MSELPKTYEPQAIEEKWYNYWLEKGCFTADPASPKPAYSIVIPPPNVTGVLTLGHVLNNTIQDILARRARMLGKEVLWLPGTDHAGIATQSVVERTLKKSGEIRHRDDLGREKFLEKVWQWKEKHGGIIIQQLKKLGASCDWSRECFTMDARYTECVQRVFVDLYKKGLIYRGKRMVNWDPSALTALSDEEVNMKAQNGVLYQFKVEVAEQPGTFLSIATTRPETIPGDTAVAVNPKDPRYADLIGKHVLRPLPLEAAEEQKRIPIVGDAHVDFEFGTGVLKVTPAHDKADFEIGQRHGLAAPDIMNPNGTMNLLAGKELAGLDRFKAREVAVERLRDLGLLEKEEPYQNNVGYSERSDVPVEPRLSEQWFLKYPSVAEAKACVEQPGTSERLVPVCQCPMAQGGGANLRDLRVAALDFARRQGVLGVPMPNEDTGWKLQAGRQSLTHAFGNRGTVNIQATYILPELIRTAIWLGSEPHVPPNPLVRKVHRLLAALEYDGELYRVIIIAKEFVDNTIVYDHKAKKSAFGGKSLEAHLREEKLDTQPAPNARVTIGDLLKGVKTACQPMRFFPERWAKVYDHWLGNIQDWCISRQLWWGHRVPVWYRVEQASSTPDEKAAESPSKPEEGSTAIWCDLAPPSDPENWVQDPDVLDTWFSSWLWPFATMGWPEKTETLAKFYPTTDLVTGPDIIFFWVARMIMAGFEYMGELPFRNVYFTGLIRDKQGRKMSKSLGNSPDPLVLIEQYGADALRFGIIRSAPQGQDILFDEKNVELGRNFCTKLWNAARFRQMHGGETEGEINGSLLSSDDKWILLKLDAAIAEVTKALEEYQFSEAAQALYRFFWSEFCDWYLEAIKPSLFGPDEAAKANTLAVLDFVFAHTLRLFHPFLPFITEELWSGMGYRADLPENQGGTTIMYSPWPAALGIDFYEAYGLHPDDTKAADRKYEVVLAGRKLRRDANIPSNKKVRFVLQPSEPISAHDREVIKGLLNAEAFDLQPEFAAAKGTPVALTSLGELLLPLAGLVDVSAEKTRLMKEISKVEQELTKVANKLGNESFIGSAPAHVVEEHRTRQREWQSKLQQLRQMHDSLE